MAETIEVRVPNIGDFQDVPIIEVLVKPGDVVRVDDALLTLESDKATMEVPSPAEGVVASVALAVGDRVSEGTTILTLARNGAAGETAPAPAAPAPAAPAGAEPAPSAAPAPPPRPDVQPPSAAAANPAATSEEPGDSVHASPSIRRFARELGVTLGRVDGTGPHGRITREDVQAFVKRTLRDGVPAATAGPTPVAGLPPWPTVDFAQFGPVEVVPLSRIKRISGPVLHRNWVSIPHVTNHEQADITELEAFRRRINEERPDAKLTILAFLMKAVTGALQRHPELNASLDGDSLVLKRYYNLGFAADTPQGLLVPVVRDVDRKGALELARETRELAAKAREGKLAPADMQGAGFTISSLGGIGGTAFTPIINAPEVAILGVSRSALQAVWNGSAFEPRLMLPLSLSYDHRVIDGALAARFNATLAALLADLRRSLL
jgi:pyruvate dehydrogenase E2 component (dihydrolipoamide acetyltransferase)